MDKGLILSVLLVLLSLEFMATYAQSTAPATNSTATSSNVTLNETVTSNATITTASINASTVAPANSTTIVAASNNGSTMALANNTTMVATVSNVTSSANTSTATTTAASGNIPGVQANITRQECRSKKLCAAEPTECDPAAGDNCYFLSVKEKSSRTYDFELSGQAAGYIAAGLSTAAIQSGRHRTYICANNNGGVKFFTATLNNVLIFTESLNSSNQQGTVNGGKIQCTFTAELPDRTTRAEVYAMSISTGTFNATAGELGKPGFKLLTALVNLSDPTVNITNLLNSNTTSSAFLITPTHGSFLPALLVTVCMLAFTAM